MDWTKFVVGFTWFLLCGCITLGAPAEPKGDHIQATFSAHVTHGSHIQDKHNATSAINGSVNAQVNTINGCSLEQLFQRIGEVLSNMVVSAGGTIVPSIHDDSGRNRVEFNVTVIAEQHNNVSSHQGGPRESRPPSIQRDDPKEKRSFAVPNSGKPQLSPVVESRTIPRDSVEDIRSLVQQQPTQCDVDSPEESSVDEVRSEESSVDEVPLEESSVDEDPSEESSVAEVSLEESSGEVSDSEARAMDEDFSSEDVGPDSDVQGKLLTHLPTKDHFQSSYEDGESALTPMMPYSDLPHVHNGDNYAELMNDNIPNFNTKYNRTRSAELARTLAQGIIPFDKQSNSETTDIAPASGRQYEQTAVDVLNPELSFNPQLYSDTVLDFVPSGAHPFEEGAGSQSLHQTLDNSPIGAVTDNSNVYFQDGSRSFTSGGGQYYENFAPETQSPFSPLGQAVPFDSIPSPADFHDTFKQGLTEAANDIGSNNNDVVRNNAFFKPEEDGPYFPKVRETRYNRYKAQFLQDWKIPVPPRLRMPPQFGNASLSQASATSEDPTEDNAPAEELPLRGKQPPPLSGARIKISTGNQEMSNDNSNLETEHLVSAASPTISSGSVAADTDTGDSFNWLHRDFDVPDPDPSRLKNIDVLRAILFREFLQQLRNKGGINQKA